ncbi:hypothetical protein F5B20DRAFT_558123 [Whalleya microplaca]|nr:hypothetical protein F5B20DRAFT_558123 [Whalleya microplaca]
MSTFIAWQDSCDENGNGGVMQPSAQKVTGGRLGRGHEHTLEDVPNCFVRDFIMENIDLVVEENKRDDVRKAVFTDLSTSEIEEYAALIRRKSGERSTEADELDPPTAQDPERAGKIQALKFHRGITEAEAECILRQEDLIDAVDATIDLTPKPGFSTLTGGFLEKASRYINRSVIRPGDKLAPEEKSTRVNIEIDRDCDQVRAMIKILIRRGHWTAEQFTQAMAPVSRPQINAFLQKRGPRDGRTSFAFQAIWEFFKRREQLGLKLTARIPQPKLPKLPRLTREVRALQLQEVDPNRGRKRPARGGQEKPAKNRKV